MSLSTKLLRAMGWVPRVTLPTQAPDGIMTVSYGGLRNGICLDGASVPPLTEAVDKAAADLYHFYGGKPIIVFAVSDFFAPQDVWLETIVRGDYFRENGIPLTNVKYAHGTHDTISEAQQMIGILKKEMPNLRSVLLCVNDLHARRALPTYQQLIGNQVQVYVHPVPCEEYSDCRLPVWWRRLSIRCDFCWAWYMFATWVAWKLKLIK